jgi:hypothetical protein
MRRAKKHESSHSGPTPGSCPWVLRHQASDFPPPFVFSAESVVVPTQVCDVVATRLGLKSPISAAISASSTRARVFFFKGVTECVAL